MELIQYTITCIQSPCGLRHDELQSGGGGWGMKPGRLLHLLNGAGFGYCLSLTELLVSLGRCQTQHGSRNELYVGTAEPPFSEAGREREGGRSHSALCLSLWKKRHADEGWLRKARLLLTEGNTCERREHTVWIQNPGRTHGTP